MSDNEIQVVSPSRMERAASFSFAPTTFMEAIQFSERIANTELVPKAFRGKPNDILVAIQMGGEVGLPPMQSLKSICVINGMPSLYGDGFLAVIMGHPAFEWIKEDDLTTIETKKQATCIIKRRGMEPHTVTFTYAMAELAGLKKKQGPWTEYPTRQCQMRARGFCGRNTFPDALRGINIFEESLDTPGTMDARDYPLVSASATSQEVVDEPIGAAKATSFYKAYTASGWSKSDADSFLRSTFDIDKEKNKKDSRDIPSSRYEEAMEWATTRNPEIPENLDAE